MAVEGYTLKKNGVPRTGPSVDALLDKIDGIGNATTSTAGLMSASDKSKLDNISAGAEVNVQSDWNETDNTKDAFIKNRPGVENTPTFRSNKLITSGGVYSALLGKQSTIQTQASIGQSFGVVYSKSSTTRVDISDFTLVVGGIVSFYNSETQMPNGTLKINSDGTSYPIYNDNTQVSSLPVGIVSLMFDGTHWQYLGVSIKGIDSTPTANSTNLVTSGGVKSALNAKQDTISDLASIRSGAQLGSTAIQSETDPTVPSWAKQSTKPTYTASEVGALPSTTTYAGSTSVGGSANKTAAIPYGVVDSTSTATNFTATVDGITELRDGVCVLLKNSVVTSTTNFTININGLGAKPSYNNMATGNPITPTNPTRDTTIFNINYTMLFVYSSTLVSGGAWICYRGYDGNTNTIGYQLRTNSYSLLASDAFRYYKILFTSADGTRFVPSSADSVNSATSLKAVNQRPINPLGEIVYCGNTTAYSSDSAIGATSIWQQYNITLGYSFNRTGAALALTTRKPLYIKCAPQANGSAIIDANTPYVQNLPSSEDGKIYILLGMATGATTVEILMNHPVYYYKDSAIRLWTNAPSSSIPSIDTEPTEDSDNLVTSGGVYDFVQGIVGDINTILEEING